MSNTSTDPVDAATIRYSVRVTPEEHQALTWIAPLHGCATPAAYLRHVAHQTVRSAASGGGAGRTPAPPSTDHADWLRALGEVLASLQNLDRFLRATLGQAIASHWITMKVWRLLADEKSLPPNGANGVHPHILAEIQAFQARIVTDLEKQQGT